jgi:hypothetical protein
MRIILNKTMYEGDWKTVKIFCLIPTICYNPENSTIVIVWLEYIYKFYKKFATDKYYYEGSRTINKKPLCKH